MKQVIAGFNLMESRLRWVLTGRVKCQENQSHPSVSMLTYTSSPISAHLATQCNDKEPATDHKPLREDFWKLEKLGISEPTRESDDNKALS